MNPLLHIIGKIKHTKSFNIPKQISKNKIMEIKIKAQIKISSNIFKHPICSSSTPVKDDYFFHKEKTEKPFFFL